MKNRHVTIGADTVIKRFDDVSWAHAEQMSYDRLSRIVVNLPLSNGWALRAPKVLRTTPTEIEMERVPGLALNQIIREGQPIPWWQIGEALAFFHKRSGGTLAKKPLYSDIGVGNILISPTAKEISFIDPGVNFGTIGPVTQDVLMVLWAIFSARLRHRRTLRYAESQFLEGYNSILEDSEIKEFVQLLSDQAGLNATRSKLYDRWKRPTMRHKAGRLSFAVWSSLVYRILVLTEIQELGANTMSPR